jgi:two-component sensor histidine kinase
LLALLVAIALPIACLTAIAAFTTYRTVNAAIALSQARAADDFAVRTRLWYRGALRTLLASGAAVSKGEGLSSDCAATARAVLDSIRGFEAVLLAVPGATCTASQVEGVSADDLARAAAELQTMPPIKAWGGSETADVRYGQSVIGGRPYLVVGARAANGAGGLFAVDPALLDQVYDLGAAGEGMNVALVSRSGNIVVARGAGEVDASWLPSQTRIPDQQAQWSAPSRSGETRSYVARMVADPDLYVIASFDGAPEQAAYIQFLTLLIAPLLTLGLLCLVYLRAIDQHCVRWLRGIEAAARARSTLSSARAVVADDMPSDIRSVAEAFNSMVDEQEVRQRKLQTALDDNRYLVRELHHRVKNSLQVVQSYIGLTKRDYRGEARLALSDAECRVHVLSAAYRFTLADGEMQPVRVDLFLDDVVTMISNLLRNRDQWISSTLDTQAVLSVDRIIPLGFLIVDVVSRALRDTPNVSITVAARGHDEGAIEVEITADRDLPRSEPPKLFAGLIAQIEAVQTVAPEGRALGAWRIDVAS